MPSNTRVFKALHLIALGAAVNSHALPSPAQSYIISAPSQGFSEVKAKKIPSKFMGVQVYELSYSHFGERVTLHVAVDCTKKASAAIKARKGDQGWQELYRGKTSSTWASFEAADYRGQKMMETLCRVLP